MHAPLEEQQKALALELRGHYGYYGRVGNRGRLLTFLARVIFIWKQWLGRRSQRPLYWKGMYRLLRRFPLPRPVQLRLRPA
jgi:RNA-directed DNA polymerase